MQGVTRIMYHTQEKRAKQLLEPIICTRNDAWLGNGYYFWLEENDAVLWGHNSKKATGYFEIYKADICCNDVLDTVFNEVHYNFWVQQIEKIAKNFKKKTGQKPTIKEINVYLRNKWGDEVTGILFQDNPMNKQLMVENFPYKKRVQIVVYKLNIVSNFTFHDEMECVKL